MAKVVSTNISDKKGVPKTPCEAIELVPGAGVKGDAHAAPGDRQVSLLAIEDIEAAGERLARTGADAKACAGVELRPGSFAENVTTQGIELASMKIGQELMVGSGVKLRISKIGKECDRPCAIYYKTGDCIMPTRGVFAEVIDGGAIKPGDKIEKG